MGAYSNAVLALNPLSYWRLGETAGATIAVDEKGVNDGTYTGTPTLGAASMLVGDTDTSVYFTAATDRVATAPSNGVNSIAFMGFCESSGIDYQPAFCQYIDANNRVNIFLAVDNGGSRYGGFSALIGGVGYTRYTDVPLYDGSPHLFCVVFDGVDTVMYVDGVLQTSKLLGINLFQTTPTDQAIGSFRYLTTWNGSGVRHIDEFAVFTDALTQQEITTLYSLSLTPYTAFDVIIDHTKIDEDLYDFPLLVNLGSSSGVTSVDTTSAFSSLTIATINLLRPIYINPVDNDPDYAREVLSLDPVAYWRLGEAVGQTVVVDEIGNFNSTYSGTPILETTGLLTNDPDTAVDFDGIGDYCHVINTATLVGTPLELIGNTNTSWTVGGSFSTTGGTGTGQAWAADETIIELRGEGVSSFIPFSIGVELGFFTVGCTGSGIDTARHRTTTTVNDGLKHHFVCVFNNVSNATTVYIYVDDVAVDSYLFPEAGTEWSAVTNYNLTIGCRTTNLGAPASYFDGVADELFMFNDKALTASQISGLYDRSIDDMQPADSTNQTQLCKAEVDRWDDAGTAAQVWIKVPYISKDMDTYINLSYNSANEDNSTNVGLTGTTPAKAVWSEYDGVYHMSADGSESAANSLDGTLVGIDGTNIVDFGVGKGLSFNGTDEWIALGDSTLDIGLTDFYLRIAFTLTTTSISYQIIYSNGGSSVASGIHYLAIKSGGTLNFYANGLGAVDFNFATTILINTDYIVEISIDRSGLLTAHVNGVIDTNTFDVSASSAVNLVTTQLSYIGRYGGTAYVINGIANEVHIANSLKSASWIVAGHSSTTDALVEYVGALDSQLNAKVSITIVESVSILNWLIRAYRLDTGALVIATQGLAGVHEITVPLGSETPLEIAVIPDQGGQWAGITVYSLNDLVFPADPETTSYYYKCTVAGTTGATEPVWPTTPGLTVVDGTVTWENVEGLVQPITHSPMIPK